VSVFQAMTQINEITLTFIPKIAASVLALLVFGPWMLTRLVNYTTLLFQSLPATCGDGRRVTLPDPLPFVLVVARLSGLVIASPIFGHGLVPARVRAGLVGVLALALAPVVPAPHLDPATPAWTLAGLVALEGVIGVCLGFVAQLIFAGVQLGGQVAGIQVGFGIANVIDPTSQAGRRSWRSGSSSRLSWRSSCSTSTTCCSAPCSRAFAWRRSGASSCRATCSRAWSRTARACSRSACASPHRCSSYCCS
jgi:hypothetical protein